MQLEGTWHVIATNFPMWLKGDKLRPRFIYSNVRTVDGREVFDDTVAYEQGGREKTIVGVDTSDGPGKYVWRGRGWLRFFVSRWEILSVSPDEQCLALGFTKTLFTPAGFDLIARTPTVSDEVYASMLASIGGPTLKRLS
jgi:hypothetical protein